MTQDERINSLEDELRKIKDAINHNNKVTQNIMSKFTSALLDVQKQVDALRPSDTSNAFDDVFGGPFRGKK